MAAALLAVPLVACLAAADPVALWNANGVPLCTLPDCGGNYPKLLADGRGGALVIYQGGNVSFDDVNAHRVTALGERDSKWPVGGVALDNHHPDRQHVADVASDGAGGVFVVWYDTRGMVPGGTRIDLYAQHLLGNGEIAPGWPPDGLPICVVHEDPWEPRILPDGQGGAMIVWEDWRTGDYHADIYALRISGDGQRYPGWPENGLAICSAPGWSWIPYVVPDGAGGFVVGWADGRDGTGGDIYALRMNADGFPAPGWNVNGNPVVPDIGVLFGMAPDDSGGAYLGIKSAVDYFDDVYVSRVTGNGQPAAGWPAGGLALATQPASQTGRHVVADGQGGAFLSWVDFEPGREGVVVQRVLADGSFAPGWNPQGARVSPVQDFQLDPHMAPDGMGGVYVVFHVNQSRRSHLQYLTAQGTPAAGWPEAGVPLVSLPTSNTQRLPRVLPDGEGGVIVAWVDNRNGIGSQIYVQRYRDESPTSTQLSLQSVVVEPGIVNLRWQLTGAAAEGVVERRTADRDWAYVGRGSFDAAGVLVFEDRSVVAGMRYAYRLRIVGTEIISEETWVQVPAAFTLELAGATPNPSSGPLTVSFTLPSSAPASLSLVDLSGRRIASHQVGLLGAGRHRVRLADSGAIPPGIYWLRLTQAGRVITTRAAIVR